MRASKALSVLTITTILLFGIVPVQADWWLDAHYDSRLTWADDEVYRIDYHMEPETYQGIEYTVYVLKNWYESWIIDSSLPYAKVWHMASHGNLDWLGYNYLLTYYDESIYGGEIPSLRNVHGGGAMLLGFGSACYSGRSAWIPYMLHEGFIDNGAVAYMGYWDPVGDYDAYRFADRFYYYISRHS